MNTITIQWSEEDRARVDKLIGLLEGIQAPKCDKCVEHALAFTHAAKAAETPQTAPEEAGQAQTPPAVETAKNEPQAVSVVPSYALPDVLAKVQALIKAGKKAECREIVTEYSASVSTIPPEKYTEVMERLASLEG